MSNFSFLTTVDDVRIRVFCSCHPAEGDGWHEPKTRAHIQIDDIEFEHQEKDRLLQEYYEYLQEEAERR